MNQSQNDLRKASQLIIGVLDDPLNIGAALAQWPKTDEGSEKALKNAYHFLHHYLADEDIRKRDAGYANRQRETLKHFADELSARAQNL